MSLKPFQMNFLEMYGDNLGLLSSAGVSFWFKLQEIPSVAQSLLRIQTLTVSISIKVYLYIHKGFGFLLSYY